MYDSVMEVGDLCHGYQMLYFTSSSLSRDDVRIYGITDRDNSPQLFVKDLKTGKISILTDNSEGVLKSYVYFNGTPFKGFGKASVALDPNNDNVYYIQDNKIKVVRKQQNLVLAEFPENRVSAFNHVSHDSKYLCVPSTDSRALDYESSLEGEGLDLRPSYSVDKRCIDENLNSYIGIYDTENGELVKELTVPRCWITHVQFSPINSSLILFNNEWTYTDTGIRRIWLWDIASGEYKQLRTTSFDRSAKDWVCHEMWSSDGKFVIYHGVFESGRAFVGRINIYTGECVEIPLSEEYTSYGHFTVFGSADLICDGYFRYPGEILRERENSTDNGPDPNLKNGRYISIVHPDWENKTLKWFPLCTHDTSWLGQDTHPHPVASHDGLKIFFTSQREGQQLSIYSVKTGRTL